MSGSHAPPANTGRDPRPLAPGPPGPPEQPLIATTRVNPQLLSELDRFAQRPTVLGATAASGCRGFPETFSATSLRPARSRLSCSACRAAALEISSARETWGADE